MGAPPTSSELADAMAAPLPDGTGIARPRSAPAAGGSACDDQVTDPQQISQILQRLWESRCLLATRVAGEAETCTTTILRVDPQRQRLELDELTPACGHQALMRERELHVRARLDGVELAFQARLEHVAWERGIAIYTLPFPQVLHYAQKRGAHRVTLRTTPPVAVRLGLADGSEVVAEVKDLSVGGLCLRVPTPDVGGLARGDRVPTSELVFPDGRRLRCGLEVRHLGGAPGSGRVQLGLRFVDLSHRQQSLIARFILQLERERMRVRPPSGRER